MTISTLSKKKKHKKGHKQMKKDGGKSKWASRFTKEELEEINKLSTKDFYAKFYKYYAGVAKRLCAVLKIEGVPMDVEDNISFAYCVGLKADTYFKAGAGMKGRVPFNTMAINRALSTKIHTDNKKAMVLNCGNEVSTTHIGGEKCSDINVKVIDGFRAFLNKREEIVFTRFIINGEYQARGENIAKVLTDHDRRECYFTLANIKRRFIIYLSNNKDFGASNSPAFRGVAEQLFSE